MTPEEEAADFLTRECGLDLKKDGVIIALHQAIEYADIGYWFSKPANAREAAVKEMFIKRASYYLKMKLQ